MVFIVRFTDCLLHVGVSSWTGGSTGVVSLIRSSVTHYDCEENSSRFQRAPLTSDWAANPPYYPHRRKSLSDLSPKDGKHSRHLADNTVTGWKTTHNSLTKLSKGQGPRRPLDAVDCSGDA